MRGTVRHHVEVNAPADAVWAVVTRPDVLHHWFPGLTSVVMKSPTVRTVTTGTGLTLDEEVVANDPLLRRFQYRISGGLFREHLASVDVIALTDDQCLVTYASDVDPAVMAVILGGVTAGALASLKEQAEAGAGPALEAIAVPMVVPEPAPEPPPEPHEEAV